MSKSSKNLLSKSLNDTFLENIKNTFDSHEDLVYLKNKKGQTTYCNNAYQYFLDNFEVGDKIRSFKDADQRILKSNQKISNFKEQYNKKTDKEKTIYLLTNKQPIYDQQKKVVGMISISKDISILEKEMTSIRFYAEHDVLTGFLNKKAFQTKFEDEINRTIRDQARMAILYIDLNSFKFINDTYGHLTGDLLIKKISQKIKKSFRKSDHLCRFGGDEFIVLITNLKSNQIKKLLTHIIEKANKEVAKPVKIKNNNFSVTMSIGYSIYPDQGKHLDTLINKADLMMYKVKKNYRKRTKPNKKSTSSKLK